MSCCFSASIFLRSSEAGSRLGLFALHLAVSLPCTASCKMVSRSFLTPLVSVKNVENWSFKKLHSEAVFSDEVSLLSAEVTKSSLRETRSLVSSSSCSTSANN